MSFELDHQTAHLRHLNIRKEIGDDERFTAIDLSMEIEAANTYLDVVERGLRAALYKTDLADVDDGTSAVRFPKLESLRWSLDVVGARATIHRGVSGSDIVLESAEINKFVLHPYDGGKVTITFRVQVRPPAGSMDALSEMVGDTVVLSVVPPQ